MKLPRNKCRNVGKGSRKRRICNIPGKGVQYVSKDFTLSGTKRKSKSPKRRKSRKPVSRKRASQKKRVISKRTGKMRKDECRVAKKTKRVYCYKRDKRTGKMRVTFVPD